MSKKYVGEFVQRTVITADSLGEAKKKAAEFARIDLNSGVIDYGIETFRGSVKSIKLMPDKILRLSFPNRYKLGIQLDKFVPANAAFGYTDYRYILRNNVRTAVVEYCTYTEHETNGLHRGIGRTVRKYFRINKDYTLEKIQ